METAIAIFHGLGDCINATTLIIPIITKFKSHKIVWISSKAYAPIAYNNPYISKIHEVPGSLYLSPAAYDPFKMI
jgi:ADP-heptose:LPS heptosyltransferase